MAAYRTPRKVSHTHFTAWRTEVPQMERERCNPFLKGLLLLPQQIHRID